MTDKRNRAPHKIGYRYDTVQTHLQSCLDASVSDPYSVNRDPGPVFNDQEVKKKSVQVQHSLPP